MRINPVNNNISQNNRAINILKKTAKYTLATPIALAAMFGLSYAFNKDEWDTFIKEKKQERLENVRYEPLIKDFDTHEAAVNYAFDRIMPWINDIEPREYSVKIDNKTHRILSEFRGQEHSVASRKTLTIFAKEIFVNDFTYTRIHGHPGYKNGISTTFSDVDLESFLRDDLCTEDYVLNRDRKYCRLKKEENYRKPTDKELNKILEDYTQVCNIAVAWQKTIRDESGNVVFEIIDYPAMHDALKRYLEPYGISYVTTYGTYGSFKDIYKDGFYEGFKDGKLL